MGVPAGLAYALLWFATGRSLGNAALSGAFFAVIMGAFGAYHAWRQWPGAGNLAAADRVKVVRSVRRGEGIDDPRLAPAVLEYAASVRGTQERERRLAWFVWLIAAGTLALALADTINKSFSKAVVWWVLVAFWVGFFIWVPRKRARLITNAQRAEDAAKELVPQVSGPSITAGASALPPQARPPLRASSAVLAVLGLLACFVVSFGLPSLELALLVAIPVGIRWKKAPGRERAALALIWAAALLLFVRFAVMPRAVFRTVRMGSRAMTPTIERHDRVLFNRLEGFDIGDIVAFHPPKDAHHRVCGPTPHTIAAGGAPCTAPEYEQKKGFYIRRVVAGPGDTVAIANGQLIRDGVPETARYVTSCRERQCNFPTPIRISRGMWFLMSDNRRESDDSRFFGPIPGGWIIGPAIFRTWPPDRVGTL
jgi:signal peptidase I